MSEAGPAPDRLGVWCGWVLIGAGLLIILTGDTAVHIVNGKTNMKITRARRPVPDKPGEWQPLSRGRIVLQAEGAEVMYRNIEVQPLKKRKDGG